MSLCDGANAAGSIIRTTFALSFQRTQLVDPSMLDLSEPFKCRPIVHEARSLQAECKLAIGTLKSNIFPVSETNMI